MAAAARANCGVLATEEQALDAMVRRLAERLDPQAIWLFGSRASGQARPESDFDLLIVAKTSGKFGSDDYETVDGAVRDLRLACDLVPCSAEDFDEGMQSPTSFVAQIVRSGRQLLRQNS